MTTKMRFRDQYRLELRERDHLPPHVHLNGIDVRISLETLACDGHCARDLLNEVLPWVKQHREELLEEWKKWHP